MKIFIGYDPREQEAYDVCAYSIKKHEPLAEIIPLDKRNIPAYTRPVDELSSTEFTFTRFLVPFLTGYKGTAMFVDCDFLFTESPRVLFNITHPLMLVKHNYNPSSLVKMDGRKQTQYHRKNWSSLMVFDCEHPSNQVLTPELVNTASGLYLHQFQWIQDTDMGDIDPAWNYLAGYTADIAPKAIHYTEGGPWFEQYKDCEYADLWLSYKAEIR